MIEEPGKHPIWNGIRRYYLLPVTVLSLGGLVALIMINKVKTPFGPHQSIQGQWDWNDSTIFEFQKMSLRFKADSFFMTHRFLDPRDPKSRLPCSQADYQMYVSGSFFLEADSLLRFDGNYTDFLFSRDTLRLCRDTGFRAQARLEWKGDTLCLKGEAFARLICFARAEGGE